MLASSPSGTTGDLPLVWNLPLKRNPNFTGRDSVLADLELSFLSDDDRNRVQVISGPAGVGKTQIAAEYAYRHNKKFVMVWWIPAESPVTIAESFAKLAGRLGELPPRPGLDVLRENVMRALDKRDDWLLIFDNAAAPEHVQPYLPPARTGEVIVTTRRTDWQGTAKVTEIPPWDRIESITFLRHRSGRRDNDLDASRIAQALNDLPLALDQAATYIQQANVSFSTYLARFERHWAELLRHARQLGERPTTVAMAWELSFQEVSRLDPAAIDLVTLCAFLSPDGVERDFLRASVGFLPMLLSGVVSDPSRTAGAVDALSRYSLADASNATIKMHRLVAGQARDRLTAADRMKWCEAAVRVAAGSFHFDSQDVSTWARCAEVLPHALGASGYAETLRVAPVLTAELLNSIGSYLYNRGEYHEARSVLQRALNLMQPSVEATNPRLAAFANDLGRAEQRLGELDVAQRHFEMALKIDEATYGQDDPHVATVANNLGTCLRVRGDREAARQQFEWALGVFQRHYGDQHGKVASVMNNLAYALRGLGDLPGATQHFRNALRIAELSDGPSHPNVASILSNLGVCLRLARQVDSAREVLEQALAIDTAVYGEKHPNVARDLSHLGEALQDVGHFEAAKEKFERALAITEAVYGSDHLAVIGKLHELGRLLKASGDVDGAIACFDRAADISRRREKRDAEQEGRDTDDFRETLD